jgi:predicted RNA-binding protein Jag
MSIPENHVTAEGRSLRAAVESAAAQLGVPVALVQHKLDLSHFRNASGAGIGVETVKIFAWARDTASLAPLTAAEDWMKGLLASMEKTGTVRGELRDGGVVLHVDVGEEGRHLVGRGGATLRSILHLLDTAVGVKHPGVQFRIDVARHDADERGERGGDRGDRGDRGGDRGDRGGDRGDRGGDRGDRGGRDRGDRGDRGGRDRDRGDRGGRRNDEAELRKLARKLAAKAIETGEAQAIRRELNSYDRRVVHTEVAEIAGARSRSVGEGADRRVEIYKSDEEDASE